MAVPVAREREIIFIPDPRGTLAHQDALAPIQGVIWRLMARITDTPHSHAALSFHHF